MEEEDLPSFPDEFSVEECKTEKVEVVDTLFVEVGANFCKEEPIDSGYLGNSCPVTEDSEDPLDINSGSSKGPATGYTDREPVSLGQNIATFSVNSVHFKTNRGDDLESGFVEVGENFCKKEPSSHNPSRTSDQEAEDPQEMDEPKTDFVKCPSHTTTQGKTAVEFQVHLRFHAKDKPLKCNFCSEYFPTTFSLRRHCNTHAGEKRFNCGVCPKSFFFNNDLIKHETIHLKKKPFQCKVCLKRFPYNHDLIRHQRTHNRKQPFKCNFCPKQFSVNSSLKRHESLHMNNSFKCKVCRKYFTDSGSLKEHEETHTQTFLCEICKKHFSKKVYLRKHEKRHQNNSFSLNCYLNNHDRTTNEEMNGAESKQELDDDTEYYTSEDTKECLMGDIKVEFPIDEDTKEFILGNEYTMNDDNTS